MNLTLPAGESLNRGVSLRNAQRGTGKTERNLAVPEAEVTSSQGSSAQVDFDVSSNYLRSRKGRLLY